MYDTIDDLMLDCVTSSKFIDSPSLWERYKRLCARNNTLPLPGQARAALGRLRAAGKIIYDPQAKAVKRVA